MSDSNFLFQNSTKEIIMDFNYYINQATKINWENFDADYYK